MSIRTSLAFSQPRRLGLLLAALLASALLGACGGRPIGPAPQLAKGLNDGAGTVDQLPGGLPGHTVPSLRPQPQIDQARLPSIETLADSQRAVSIQGPGYRSIPPLYYSAALNFAQVPGEKLESNGLPPFAYAAYTLHNFPAGCYPTDLKVTTDTTGEEYWVAFADFENRRWIFNGPFNASAQVEIPFAGRPGGLFDFVSDNQRAVFLLLAPEGTDVVLAGLELGVHGGAEAPTPVNNFQAEGGTGGLLLYWPHSSSFGDADFLGYVVERAPLLSGEFAPLHPQPLRDTSFLDETAELELDYRYRLACVDSSGNRSYSPTLVDHTEVMGDTPPLLRVRFNPGPFQGRTTVEFDFAGSFDPDGTPISEYRVEIIGSQQFDSGPGPLHSLELPPGCYLVRTSVTSNMKDTEADYTLKVYPVWQDTPVTVAAAEDGLYSRLLFSRMRYLSDNQTIALMGYDLVSDAMVVWTGQPGGVMTPHRFWTFFPPQAIEEPILYKGALVMPIVSGDLCLPFAWNPQTDVRSIVEPVPAVGSGRTKVSVLTDGETAFAVSGFDNGLTFDIVLTSLFDSPPGAATIASALPGVEAVAAVYNLSANAIDVVYGNSATTEWRRWSLDSNSVVGMDTLSASSSDSIDVEINPATGEPAVCFYNASRIRYRQYDGASWGAEELIEPVLANFKTFDLRFAHGTRYCYSAFDTGYSALYEYDAGGMNWQQRNTPDMLPLGAMDTTIVNGADVGEILALDRDAGNNVYLFSLQPGDNDDLLTGLNARTGQGLQLRGCGGSDGLHLVHTNREGKPYHYLGNDDGSGWSAAAMPWNTVTSLDIGAQSQGEVYLSLNNADASFSYQLEYWDPGLLSFVNEVAPVVGSSDYHPFLGESSLSEEISWTYFDEVAGELEMLRTNQTTGLSTVTRMIGMDPVWRGATASSSPNKVALLHGGGAPWDAAVKLFDRNDSYLEEQYSFLFGGGPLFALMTGLDVDGRTMDGATYLKLYDYSGLAGYLPSEIYAVAQGPILNAAVIDVDLLNQKQITFLETANPFGGFFSTELRRTCSVAQGTGASAMLLISTLGGGDHIFRWGDFGRWEDLPLPAGISHMNRPELLVSRDNRWHIVYHDWATDEIKCISTL